MKGKVVEIHQSGPLRLDAIPNLPKITSSGTVPFRAKTTIRNNDIFKTVSGTFELRKSEGKMMY